MAAATALVALVAAMFVVPATSARAQDTTYWCDHHAAPCIVSLLHDDGNGGGLQPVTETDPNFDAYALKSTGGGFTAVTFAVQTTDSAHDAYDLGAASTDDTWQLTLDMGTIPPRMVFLRGDNLVTKRVDNGDGTFSVRITGSPTRSTTTKPGGSGGCDQSSWPWHCPFTADGDRYEFSGEVNDNGGWDDKSQVDDFWGSNMWTNIEASDWPPQVENDPTTGTQQLVTDLASPHEYTDHTVVHGFLHQVVPYAYIHDVYGVDDPSSMTSGSLSAGFTGADTSAGSVSATPDPSGKAMDVDATGLRFSAKKLHVRLGAVTPTRPRHVSGKRLSAHKARVSFARSKSRGSKVRGYTVRCVSGNGKHHATASSRRSPTRVAHLVTGTAYTCQVRARSHAGHSGWSAKVQIRRHR